MIKALIFLFLGIAGSAGPAHFGMRVLAHRQHLDKQLPFEPGTEKGGLPYAWWLMRFRHLALPDAPLRQFGTISAIMGWIMLFGITGSAICIALNAGT